MTLRVPLVEQKLLPPKAQDNSPVYWGGVVLLNRELSVYLYWSPLLVFLSFYLSAIVLSVPPSLSEALYHYRGDLSILVHNSRLVIYVLIFQNKTSISLTLNNLSMTFCRQAHHELLQKKTLSHSTCSKQNFTHFIHLFS